MPTAFAGSLKSTDFGGVPSPSQPPARNLTFSPPFALAERMPIVARLFGTSGSGFAVLITTVCGSGASTAVKPRTAKVKDEGEFSTVGTRQKV